ncbi:hypothetical protein PFICI_08793 [Pestalotiopsis fici W106-1]|uniref:Receptor L-domain domain-containing protein n=1 Tax=Pestalotiopsis fici (strain W106-1 / CGMCC3.15140) TaxID=1229662 RepID=W3WYL4_PESFW|nr:uncharacterized protein PFICI_08793 [Pestalotiopsis fici W106-1]ETS78940.1 hypothetical protein PFICI_08793 [Pestalotiopsis fici W106-1]
MSLETCPGNITVSSLEDIQEGPFRRCDGPIDNLLITSSTDKQLNFTSRPLAVPISNILVQDNPALEKIQLPFQIVDLSDRELGRVEITGSPALKDIDCSHLSQYSQKNFSISDISDGTIDFDRDASASEIYLRNNVISIKNLPELSLLKSVGTVFTLWNVSEIHTMEVQQAHPTYWFWRDLQSIDTIIWTNISTGFTGGSQYEIRNDMIVGPSILDKPPPIEWVNGNMVTSMMFENVVSIGRNLNITENMFITIDVPNLEKVSGGLNIEGNVNCTLNFNTITRIGSLYAVNNPFTTLPGWFPELEEADDIYLNGYIDPSRASNIFPSLKIVHNSIRLEPWNSDFNCTHFLAQANNLGFGGTPYCNSTTDDSSITPESIPTSGSATSNAPPSQTSSSNSPPPSSSSPISPASILSPGAWGGIGAGIAVVLIGGGGLAYLLLRLASYKKKLRQQQQGHAGQEGQDVNGCPVDGPEQKETAARGVIRYEADGAQILESANRQVAPQPREPGNTAVPAEMGAPRLLVELP